MKLYELIKTLDYLLDNELFTLTIKNEDSETEIPYDKINDSVIYSAFKWYEVKSWCIYDISKEHYYIDIEIITK